MSFWYKDHSTPNPLGVLPDPAITKIVVGDKFSDQGSSNGALKLNVLFYVNRSWSCWMWQNWKNDECLQNR